MRALNSIRDEANVLERFCKASIKFKLDAIIRVCADNPFVDSKEIGILVDAYKQTNFINDYYFNHKNYQNKTCRWFWSGIN